MGYNASSWEQKDSRVLNDDRAETRIRDPHWLLSLSLTLPIYLLGWFVSMMPWLCAVVAMLYMKPKKSTIPIRVMLDWYQGSPQVALNYLSVGSKVIFGPVLFFLFAVAVRYTTRLVAGANEPTDPDQIHGNFESWRATLMRTLFPESQLLELNELLGYHNEARSSALRLLGARVGRRVCWPSTGPSVLDYRLLNIGDDVTFGDSNHLLTTDEEASGIITVGNGAVIADRVCILPGVTVGERTTLGFGTLTRRHKRYDDGTFIGCKNGDVARSDSFGEKLWAIRGFFASSGDGAESDADGHDADSKPGRRAALGVRVSDETLVGSALSPSQLEHGRPRRTPPKRGAQLGFDASHENSPYNRAVYQHDAPYYVLSPLATLFFSFAMTAFTAFYWNVPALSSMKLAARFFVQYMEGVDSRYDVYIVYALNVLASAALTTTFSVMALAFVIVSKRLLIGRYRSGVYDWDKSLYPQRRQIVVATEKLIRRCYVDKGILSLLTGTHWLVMYYRALGVRIGRDCALFANGYPSLMITETDLLEIGDRVVIISHIDRRGSMRLGRIKIGNRCVLRSVSSIMCGAEMKDESCLLQHNLVLPGEVVHEKWTMHRRPAERFYGSRKGSIPVHK